MKIVLDLLYINYKYFKINMNSSIPDIISAEEDEMIFQSETELKSINPVYSLTFISKTV